MAFVLSLDFLGVTFLAKRNPLGWFGSSSEGNEKKCGDSLFVILLENLEGEK